MRARSSRIVAGGLVLAALVPAAASAGLRLQGVDASGHPTVRASVVTSSPTARPPRLTENGNVVVGLRARNLAREKSVAVLLDRSRSMKGKPFRDATAAARQFVASKPASDRIGLVVFGSTAVSITGFTSAASDVQAALGAVAVDKRRGTALYDAVVLAARQLGGEDNPSRVLVLLTDGTDVSSDASLGAAVAAAHKAGVAIYPIGIAGETFRPAALKELARATGGTYHLARSTDTLPEVYAAIGRELARTWRVEYFTSARPGDTPKLVATVPGAGRATVTFRVPGEANKPASAFLPSALTSSFGSTMTLALLVALLVLGAAVAAMATREGAWVRNRLEPHLTEPTATRKSRGGGRRFSGFHKVAAATDDAFSDLKQWRALRRLLERADLPLRPSEFVYLAVGAGFGLGLVVALSGTTPIAIVVAMALGGAFPFAYAWFRAGRRLKQFENQLPDLLVTVAASLKAGHSFRQGLATVVEEGQPPASTEFKRVLTETRLGRPMDDALTEMGERVGSKNLEFVITAVTIQRQVGGSLAGLFDMVADAVRQRQQFARKIKGLTAMGRASAYTLIGLPFFVAFCLTLLNADYMSPLWHSPTGHKLIFIGLTMMAFGSLVLKKIVSFRG